MGNTSNQGLDPMALARLVQAVNQRVPTSATILGSLLGPFAPAPPEQPMTEEQSRMGVTYPAQFQPVADLAALLAGSTRTGPGRAVLGSETGAVGKLASRFGEAIKAEGPIEERLSHFLNKTVGDPNGKWIGEMSAAEQKQLFGHKLAGKRRIVIDGAKQEVRFGKTVSFGQDWDWEYVPWKEVPEMKTRQ